jgi:hypothetical protein
MVFRHITIVKCVISSLEIILSTGLIQDFILLNSSLWVFENQTNILTLDRNSGMQLKTKQTNSVV